MLQFNDVKGILTKQCIGIILIRLHIELDRHYKPII